MQQNFSARCHSIVLRRHQNKPALRVPSAAFRQENNSHIFFFLQSYKLNIKYSSFKVCLEFRQECKLFNLLLPDMKERFLHYWCERKAAGI